MFQQASTTKSRCGPIYKSYPIYDPDREPKGYIEWLRSREPQIDWDASKLTTRQDWIRAGETVFDAPLLYCSFALTQERVANIEDVYVRKLAFFAAAVGGWNPAFLSLRGP